MIPKRPEMPDFPPHLIEHIGKTVFDFPSASARPTCAFVFGGTHFGAWQRTIEADQEFHFSKVFVTGGHKRTGVRHFTWSFGEAPEADIIKQKLIEGGIAPERIETENASENTKDNVLNVIEKIRMCEPECIALIGRSYGIGRQARTFKNFCGEIQTVSMVYDMEVNGVAGNLTGQNWKDKAEWRSVVWGEYIRIVAYGRIGHVFVDFATPDDLLAELEQYLIDVGCEPTENT